MKWFGRFGWTNELSWTWEVWFIAYYLTFITASLVVLIRWWKNIDQQYAPEAAGNVFLISILIPLFLGISPETVPTLLSVSYFPKLTIVFLMIPITTLFLASRKLGLLLERKRKRLSLRQRKAQSKGPGPSVQNGGGSILRWQRANLL